MIYISKVEKIYTYIEDLKSKLGIEKIAMNNHFKYVLATKNA